MKTIIATIQIEIEDDVDLGEDEGLWVENLLNEKVNTGEGWWAELGDLVPSEEFEDDGYYEDMDITNNNS